MTRNQLALASCCVAALLVAPGCGDDSPGEVPSVDAGAMRDDAGAMRDDAGLADTDAGPTADAGPVTTDAGPMGTDAGPSCTIAGSLTLPSGSVSGRAAGASANPSVSCSPDTGGPEQYWSLHLDETRWVRLAARTTTSSRLALAIRTACDDSTTELACNVPMPAPPGAPGGGDAAVEIILEPGDYVVLVDVLADGVGGDYTLTLTTATPAASGTCAGAMRVTDGTLLPMQRLEHTARSVVGCGSSIPIDGETLWYSTTVPAHTRLRVDAGAVAGLQIAILASCAAGAACFELASSNALYENTTAAPVDVVIAVGEWTHRYGTLTFDLSVSFEALAAGSSCGAASPLVSGVPLTGDALTAADAVLDCWPGWGPQATLYYSITVPAMHALTVDVRSDSPFGIPVTIGLREGCAGTCIGDLVFGSAIYHNASGVDRNIIVAIAARRPVITTTLPFTLTATTSPLASNALCSGPLPLTSGAPTTADTAGGGSDLACAGSPSTTLRAPLYYSVHVPAGQVLRASARSTTRASLAILTSCAGACAESTEMAGGGPADLSYPNTTGAGVDLIVAVGGDAVPGAVELLVEVGDPQDNASCASATALVAGARLVAQDTSIGSAGLATACLPSETAPVVYYSVAVPAGQRLTVTTRAAWPSIVRLLSACGATSCLASAAPPAYTTTLLHDNSGTAVENLFVAVSPSVFAFPGLFDIDVSIAAP